MNIYFAVLEVDPFRTRMFVLSEEIILAMLPDDADDDYDESTDPLYWILCDYREDFRTWFQTTDWDKTFFTLEEMDIGVSRVSEDDAKIALFNGLGGEVVTA